MSELTAAMKAAVESLDGDDRPHRAPPAPRDRGPSRGVALRHDEDHLPPIAWRRGPSTFGEALRETFGPVAAAAWMGVREGFLLIVTFWVAAILVAFAAGEHATLPVVLTATATMRLLLLAAAGTNRAVEPRSASTA